MIIAFIKVYQYVISPLLSRGACRFYPTCSHYAIEAYQRYSVLKASWLILGRLKRCHPWGGSGYDPLR